MGKAEKPVVMLLFGGQSSEHQISCATAAGVLEVIDREKWDVYPVGITPRGTWVPESDDPGRYRLGAAGGYTVADTGTQVAFVPGEDHKGRPRLVEFTAGAFGEPTSGSLKDGPSIDVVFPLLHGPYGEDGSVQGLLELAPVRYVGCGIAASSVAMDKRLTKTVLEQVGVPTGEWEPVSKRQWEEDPERVLRRLERLGLPVFVKPCRAGSSMGISRVADPGEMPAAIRAAQEHDPQLIIEAAHSGRELECGILQLADGSVVASPLGEIAVDGEFYDYESKYFSPNTVRLSCPADVPEDVADRIRDVARVAFEAIGGEGLARVDFFYAEDRDDFIVNEVNTLPGFTPHSMYPRMLAAAGFEYEDLVQQLLTEALQRTPGLR